VSGVGGGGVRVARPLYTAEPHLSREFGTSFRVDPRPSFGLLSD